MPFQPINFLGAASPLEHLANSLRGGVDIGAKLSQLPQQREAQELANQLSRMQLEQEPQRFESSMRGQDLANQLKNLDLQQSPQKFKASMQAQELANQLANLHLQQEPQKFSLAQRSQQLNNALTGAQIEKMKRQSAMPFGGEIPPGDVGQAYWADLLSKKDPDSQLAKNANAIFNSILSGRQNLQELRTAQTETASKKVSSSLGKTALELEEINNGFLPGSNGKVSLSPEKQAELKGQYELKMQKDVSDSDTRKRALFASNIDKTLEGINPKDLTQYSGAKGIAKLQVDQLNSSLGKPSEDYKKYQRALTLSNLLSKQVRQFYGDSITPQIQEKLSQLSNPSSWKNDPEIAIDNFNTFKDILGKETQTYRGPLKNTKEFQGKSDSSSSGESPKRLKFNPSTGDFE